MQTENPIHVNLACLYKETDAAIYQPDAAGDFSHAYE